MFILIPYNKRIDVRCKIKSRNIYKGSIKNAGMSFSEGPRQCGEGGEVEVRPSRRDEVIWGPWEAKRGISLFLLEVQWGKPVGKFNRGAIGSCREVALIGMWRTDCRGARVEIVGSFRKPRETRWWVRRGVNSGQWRRRKEGAFELDLGGNKAF